MQILWFGWPSTKLHTYSAPPPNYIKGKSWLDYILISHSILPSIIQAGILPYNSIFLGDHRPCFLDFTTSTLFNDSSHPLATLSCQGLQLCDPRVVGEYYDNKLHELLAYHNVVEKL